MKKELILASAITAAGCTIGLSDGIFESFYSANVYYLGGIALGAGLLGGLYPAWYLSSFGPGHLFKDVLSGEKKFVFRKVVVFFQFAMFWIFR